MLERSKLKRRGAGNNSTLVQRYLAAIDGDAVELLLPPPPQSPAVSHASKSTKYTAKTVGESSGSWQDGTPTPRRRQRNMTQQRQKEQQQQQSHRKLDVSEEISTPGSLRRQEAAAKRASSATDIGAVKAPSHSFASRRGFFPRTQLFSSRNNSNINTKNNTSRGSSNSEGMFREVDVATGKLSAQKSFPDNSSSLNISLASAGDPSLEDMQSDDDSSLTSRRTSESAWSPQASDWKQYHNRQEKEWNISPEHKVSCVEQQLDQIHHPQQQNPPLPPALPYQHTNIPSTRQYRHGHPLHDHLDEEISESTYESSSEQTNSTSNDFASLPQHQTTYHRYVENAGTLSPVPKSTIEKTFDKAVEKGLDLILSTNAWACTNGAESGTDGRLGCSQPSFPSYPQQEEMYNKNVASRSVRNKMEMKYSPQRQKHGAIVQHSLSTETARSDVTGASTQIATNRAVDLAMKRIQQMEKNLLQTKGVLERSKSKKNLTEDELRQAEVVARRLTAKSMLSVSSNESNARLDKKPMNKQSPTMNQTSGRLGDHVAQGKARLIPDCHQHSEEENSSAGADLGSRNTFQAAKLSLRPVLGSRKTSIFPSVSSVPEEDLMNLSADHSTSGLTYNKDGDDDDDTEDQHDYGPSIPLLADTGSKAMNADLEIIETRTFRVTTPAPPCLHGQRQISDSSLDGIGACISPPQIVRKAHPYEQVSPDPVFCSKSMSMSVQSTPVVSPRATSPVFSVENSFESDNAMFMEKTDESCSTALSHLEPENLQKTNSSLPLHYESYPSHSNLPDEGMEPINARQDQSKASTDNHTKMQHMSEKCQDDQLSLGDGSNNKMNSQDQQQNSSAPTLACLIGMDREIRGGEDVTSLQSMEILGIRGSFQLRREEIAKDQQCYINTYMEKQAKKLTEVTPPAQLLKQKLVALVPLAIPSPTTRRVHTTNNGVADAFLTAISLKSDTDHLCGRIMLPDTKHPKRGSLQQKISRAGESTRTFDFDVDVKSIRSTFESIVSPSPEFDENDDDTASVKSLRERFEPLPAISAENGITKARAVFETRKTYPTKPFEVGNSSIKEKFSKFEASYQRRGSGVDVGKFTSRPDCVLKKANKNVPVIFETHNEKTRELLVRSHEYINASTAPLSVAARVRVLTGECSERPQCVRSQITPPLMNATTNSFVSELPQSSSKLRSAEVTSVSQRAAKQKMTTWRALRSKTMKLENSNKSLGIKNTSAVDQFQIDVNGDSAQSPEMETMSDRKIQLVESGLPPQTTIATDKHGVEENRGLPFRASSVSAHSYDDRKRVLKPTWLAQREKILSRARLNKIETLSENNADVDTGARKMETANRGTVAEINADMASGNSLTFGDNIETHFVPKQSLPEATLPVNQIHRNSIVSVTPMNSAYVCKGERTHRNPIPQCNDQVSDAPVHHVDTTTATASKFHTRTKSSEISVQTDTVALEKPTDGHMYPPFTLRGCSGPTHKEEEKKECVLDEPLSNGDLVTTDRTVGSIFGISRSDETSVPSFHKSAAQSNNISEYERINKSAARPFVVKPVARKPYVRPVPIKPVVKPVALMPCARTTTGNSNKVTSEMVGSQGYIGSSSRIDAEDALALPRLVAGILEPYSTEDMIDSTSDDSEFSDGVTLDLSIAEVSNLTNPTALISKSEGVYFEEDQTQSFVSEDCEQTSDNRSKSKLDIEAKRSEASSSQTSEAAAPLIAKALRTFPLSDEVSADSFFRSRAVRAKQLWHERTDWQRTTVTTENDHAGNEEKGCEEMAFDDDVWNILQVESMFPVGSSFSDNKTLFSSDEWNPFPLDSSPCASPCACTGESESCTSILNITPSRSKTPTRGNTSAMLNPTNMKSNLSETGKSWKALQPQSVILATVQPAMMQSYDHFSTFTNATSGSGGTTTLTNDLASGKTYGPKHVALLARIHALKDARLRRAAAIYNATTPMYPLQTPERTDELSCSTSTRSSTRFGGRNFFATLEVD